MIHCPVCNALHDPENPCPGCLVHLGLERESPEWRIRPWVGALGLGLVLGLSVSFTGLGALAVWSGSSATASPTGTVQLQEAREALEEEREALLEERLLLNEERARLRQAREELEEASLRADHSVFAASSVPEIDRVSAIEEGARRAEEAARRAEETARMRAEAARRAEESARRRAERAARAAAERERGEADARAAAEAARAEGDRARLEMEAARAAARKRAAEEAARARALESQRSGLRGVACDDLAALESRAILGKLTDRERSCLDQAIDGRERERVSQLLVVDAYTSNQLDRWRELATAHLTTIGPDVDLAYKLTIDAERRGDHVGVLRWSGEALERRTRWSGATYVSRVQRLYGMQYRAHLARSGADDPLTKGALQQWTEYCKSAGCELPEL